MSYETPPPGAWRELELYRGFITEAERLDQAGHDANRIADVLIALGCHLSEGIHDPGPVGDRLRRLATLFIGVAKQRTATALDLSINLRLTGIFRRPYVEPVRIGRAGYERDALAGLIRHLRHAERDARTKADNRPPPGPCFDVSEGYA